MPRTGPSPRVAALWTAAVALLLLAPVPTRLTDLSDAAPAAVALDKWAHVVLFALLSYAWLGATRPAAAGRALGVAAGVVAYGGLLELVQPLVSARGAEWGDVAADAAGAALALGVALRRLRRARNPSPSTAA